MLKPKRNNSIENLQQLKTIAELIVEDYRFRHSYMSVLNKLFVEERKRYESAYTFHANRIAELAKTLGLNIKTYDGWDYNEGELPVTPLNADEFMGVLNLKIQQTIEPTILTNEGNPIRYGTVILSNK